MGVRAERALATRRRMVRAAYDCFCDAGYLGTTMQSIADQAGVAVQTLYYTFHTKAALLDAALGGAVLGFDRWHDPPAELGELLPWHPWWGEFAAARTSSAALSVFVRHGVAILERVAPLVPALRGAAGDPEAETVVRLAEERRVASYREIARSLAGTAPGLRDGLTVAAAADILLVLFSAEVYDAMAQGRRWSRRRSTAFLESLLASQLIA